VNIEGKVAKGHEFVHIKPYIFHDGSKCIPNNIVGCIMFPTKETTKKVGLC
jgi:hypothetical protein